MTRIRVFLASVLSCGLLLAGLLIGSVRPAQTQGPPGTRQPFTARLQVMLRGNEVDMTGPSAITVPPGKTMVIEYAAAEALTSGPGERISLFLRVGSLGAQPDVGGVRPSVAYGLQYDWEIYLHGSELTVGRGNVRRIISFQPIGIRLQAGDTLRVHAELLRAAETIPPGRGGGENVRAQVIVSGYLD